MKLGTKINLAFLVALTTGSGVFLAVWSVIWLFRGSYPTAIIVFGFAVYPFGFAFHLAFVLSGAARPRCAWGVDGTVLRPNKLVDRLVPACLFSGVFAAMLYLTLIPLDMVDFVPPEHIRRVDLAISVFLVVFGVPTLYRVIKHGGESYLRLDQNGFEAWSGLWGTFTRKSWDDVEEILDHPVRGRKIRRDMIVFVLPKRRSAMLVTDAITNDSHALREWVRFYWKHPQYRNELTDGRALQRLGQEFIAE